MRWPKPRDLAFNPLGIVDCLSFDTTLVKKVLMTLTSSPETKHLSKYPVHVINRGVFLRSARSKQEALYWCPGLNAGFPLTPKPKNKYHEQTYAFHDVIHFCLPDLIPDGNISDTARDTYVNHRMSSEVISLIYSDMIYASQLKEYDTRDQRKIFPLYQELGGSSADLNEILHGGFCFCFNSDIGPWTDMIHGREGDMKALYSFKDKYQEYLDKDRDWTIKNWNYMKKRADSFERWWSDNRDLTYGLTEISQFNDSVNANECGHGIEIGTILAKQIENIELEALDEMTGKHRAFRNYMVGQMLIFYQYDTPFNSDYYEFIRKCLVYNCDHSYIISIYNEYLYNLYTKDYISVEQYDLYQQMYPIFEANEVMYT